MLGLETITLDKETAKTKYLEALEAEKVNKAKHLTDLKKVYWQLAKGNKIIDLFETLKKLPLNADGDPAIGIAPLQARTCFFEKLDDGGGIFGGERIAFWKHKPGEIRLPAKTFGPWQAEKFTNEYGTHVRLKNKSLQAPVPVVPPQHADLLTASDMYIIFDTPKWQPAPPDDPIIARRITANLFAIQAKWNLSKIEKAIIRGRL